MCRSYEPERFDHNRRNKALAGSFRNGREIPLPQVALIALGTKHAKGNCVREYSENRRAVTENEAQIGHLPEHASARGHKGSLTDAQAGREFVQSTGVDALAVSKGSLRFASALGASWTRAPGCHDGVFPFEEALAFVARNQLEMARIA